MDRKTIVIIGVTALVIVAAGVFAAAASTLNLKLPIGKVQESVDKIRVKPNKEEAHAKAGEQKPSVCTTSGCHDDMLTEKKPWHRFHLQAPQTAFTCPTCHKSIKRAPRSMAGTLYIDRSVCLRCHRDKFPAFSAEHRKPTWVQFHRNLRGDKKWGENIPTMAQIKDQFPQCFICHRWKELNFCKKCHEFHPHNMAWIRGGHGKRALKQDFFCVRCHTKTKWCTDQCHEGVTLPHNIPRWAKFWQDEPDAPKWWLIHYKEAARLDPQGSKSPYRSGDGKYQVCRNCHDSPISPVKDFRNNPDFCMRCHHRQFYEEFPDELGQPWIPYAMPFVKRHGSNRCWRCHQPNFCFTCHSTGSKAPPGTAWAGPTDNQLLQIFKPLNVGTPGH